MTEQEILRQLLRTSITNRVKKSLCEITKEFSGFNAHAPIAVTNHDTKDAMRIVVELIKEGCQGFYTDAHLEIERHRNKKPK